MLVRVPGSDHGLQTAVVDDVPRFEQLSPEWDQLLHQSGSRVYFLRHYWNLCWWNTSRSPRCASPRRDVQG